MLAQGALPHRRARLPKCDPKDVPYLESVAAANRLEQLAEVKKGCADQVPKRVPD
jgi:hypothetical protein